MSQNEAPACNLNIYEAEARGPRVQGYPQLHKLRPAGLCENLFSEMAGGMAQQVQHSLHKPEFNPQNPHLKNKANETEQTKKQNKTRKASTVVCGSNLEVLGQDGKQTQGSYLDGGSLVSGNKRQERNKKTDSTGQIGESCSSEHPWSLLCTPMHALPAPINQVLKTSRNDKNTARAWPAQVDPPPLCTSITLAV